MTNKNELNNEELNQVSGGEGGRTKRLQDEYSIKIDRNDTANHIGEKLFFDTYVYANGASHCEWVLGTLLNVYVKSQGCGTVLTASVSITEAFSNVYSGTKELRLDKWTAYSK